MFSLYLKNLLSQSILSEISNIFSQLLIALQTFGFDILAAELEDDDQFIFRIVIQLLSMIYQKLIIQLKDAIGVQSAGGSIPSIWRFIEGLKKEQSLNELKIEKYIADQAPP